MPQAPIFIGGAGRSGTTLLADLIGCHPRISPIYETDFLRDFALLFLAGNSPSLDEACVKAIQYMDRWSRDLPHRPHNKGAHERYVHGPHHLLFGRKEVLEATVDCVRTIRAGGDAASAIGRMSRRLFESHTAADRKARWVNKTPSNLHLLPEICRVFGTDIRFVHILRDPRDVACSVVDRPWGPARHGDVGAWWASKIQRGLAFARAHQVPYIEVRFEELVETPGVVLDRIFEFVGEEALGKEVAEYHSYGRIPFDLSRIGRWRQDFPSEDREAFIQHCGDLMEAVGYAWAA